MQYQEFVIPLVRKTMAGDSEALEQLLLSQRKIIAVIVRRWTNCQVADTEDISQEVEIRVSQKISSLQSPEAFYSWLHTIVIRECNRYIKARNKFIMLNNELCIDELFVESDPFYLPSEYVELTEIYNELKKVLFGMPIITKQIIFLHYGLGIKQKNIGDLLGVPVGTVSSTLFRMRERLNTALTSYQR